MCTRLLLRTPGPGILFSRRGRVMHMLNPKARQIFQFIVRFKSERGYPPTLREIGEEFGIASTNGVRYYLAILESDGYLKRKGKISRAIEVPEAGIRRFSRLYPSPGLGGGSEWTGSPILGKVAAGTPLLAVENMEGKLDLDSAFPGDN